MQKLHTIYTQLLELVSEQTREEIQRLNTQWALLKLEAEKGVSESIIEYMKTGDQLGALMAKTIVDAMAEYL
ncbi:MAG TPA: hypothetical protein VF209_00840 [Patescibacteria group bacterium]